MVKPLFSSAFSRGMLMLGLLPGLAIAAANHQQVVPTPATAGPYPVACSNLAHDAGAINRLGASLDQLWNGKDGQPTYLSQVLARPDDAVQFKLRIPDDGSLYPRFANQELPIVSLVCYPTIADNPRPSYRLPDGQEIPHMDGAGELPLLAEGGERLPLIVYSHGLGGSPLNEHALGSIFRFASYGYIVLNPFHGDKRIKEVKIENFSDVADMLLNFNQYVELQALRPLTLRAAITDLLQRPGYRERIHPDRIGGFGGSLGGEALMLAMGAELTRNIKLDSRPVEQDPRIRAAAAFVPYSGQTFLPAFGRGQQGARFVTRPFMAISGSSDPVAPVDMTTDALRKVQGSRYLITLQDVPHRYLPEYANDIYGWVIPFFDAYLKEDLAALTRLTRMASVDGGLQDQIVMDRTLPTPLSANQVVLSEFVNSRTGHFLSAVDIPEVELLMAHASQGWTATGQRFKAWQSGGPASICRFYRAGGGVLDGADSLYYTPDQALCDWGRTLPDWLYLGRPIQLAQPGAQGECPLATLGVSRAYNRAAHGTINYRFVTSQSELRQLQNEGWQIEATDLCAPL
ncbi:alpha/beta hydrolase family protein [Parachitinimonas caeni]|uniref:Dienelactone hydrolase n=1 Tax=Parachitinimonas caeni TaxID=3031301 RepID=A0ABT7DYQ8_9NEIS|nr:hypothetical protein [Parachitinimonas caeni]MDK2125194.1 hypothetical protein [Parachitinimonas caeni]